MVQHHNDLGHYSKCNRVYIEEGRTVMLDREGGRSLHKCLLLYKLKVKRIITVFTKNICEILSFITSAMQKWCFVRSRALFP